MFEIPYSTLISTRRLLVGAEHTYFKRTFQYISIRIIESKSTKVYTHDNESMNYLRK